MDLAFQCVSLVSDLFLVFPECHYVTPIALLSPVAAEHNNQAQLPRVERPGKGPATDSIGSWLTSCWQEARYKSPDAPTLLSPAQERALWRRIIREQHPQLFDIDASVRLAQRAAGFLAEWQIRSDGELWNDHPDAQQFQLWRGFFENSAGKKMDHPRLPLAFSSQWLTNGIVKPVLTVFLGFNEFSPGFRSACGRWADWR